MDLDTREREQATVDTDRVLHFHLGHPGMCQAGKRCMSACGVVFTHLGVAVRELMADSCSLCALASDGAL